MREGGFEVSVEGRWVRGGLRECGLDLERGKVG